jgi:hypothetical protein
MTTVRYVGLDVHRGSFVLSAAETGDAEAKHGRREVLADFPTQSEITLR